MNSCALIVRKEPSAWQFDHNANLLHSEHPWMLFDPRAGQRLKAAVRFYFGGQSVRIFRHVPVTGFALTEGNA